MNNVHIVHNTVVVFSIILRDLYMYNCDCTLMVLIYLYTELRLTTQITCTTYHPPHWVSQCDTGTVYEKTLHNTGRGGKAEVDIEGGEVRGGWKEKRWKEKMVDRQGDGNVICDRVRFSWSKISHTYRIARSTLVKKVRVKKDKVSVSIIIPGPKVEGWQLLQNRPGSTGGTFHTLYRHH